MTPDAFQAFTERLATGLAGDPDVLGLVLLGSASGLPPLPDAHSDHDLWIVARPGAAERFRRDPAWLPEPGRLALFFRETAHGVKALYEDGHLVEAAAFEPEELSVARANRYRVALDRGGVAERLAAVQAATRAQVAAAPPVDERWRAGQLLTALVVGAGRAARGERLSGHALVRGAAVEHLVALLRARLSPEARAPLDELDPYRRLERALPAEAAALEAALARPVAEAARALLELAARWRPDLVSGPARRAVEAALGPGPAC